MKPYLQALGLALVCMLAGLILAGILNATMDAYAQAQGVVHADKSQITPKPFVMTEVSNGYHQMDRHGQEFFFKPGNIVAMEYWTPGLGMWPHPVVVVVQTGANDFRLDCPDEDHARKFIDYVIKHTPKKGDPK